MKTSTNKAANASIAAFVSAVAIDTAAPSAKSLGAKPRSTAKQNATFASIGASMSHCGELIGAFTAETEYSKADLLSALEASMKEAMKLGLTVEMLKAKTECYTLLVDAINAPRIGAGLDELKASTRDNYLSRIRTFIKNRGANPLDLFGNFAVAKAKAEKPATAKPNLASEESDDVPPMDKSAPGLTMNVAPKVEGAAALQAYLSAWIEANESTTATPRMQLLIDAAGDLMSSAKQFCEAKNKY